VPRITGGFVGVDAFFVISGFLITRLIVDERASGQFSLKTFWLRRARRLMPAAHVMTLACLAAFYFVQPPSGYGDVAAAAIAGLVFSANVFFYSTTGYFDTTSGPTPLLHTWSLALEEQFYLVIPLLLMLVAVVSRKRPDRPVIVLGGVTLVSFGLSVGLANQPMLAFYLLPTRAWELGVGALLATSGVMTWAPRRIVREVLAMLGAVALVVPMFLYDGFTVFPSYTAALPVLGTAALLYTGHHGTLVSRALQWRPLVAIGIVSYSLYLWHWPALTFARELSSTSPTDAENAASLLVATALAFLSHRFVEEPIRRRRLMPSNKALIVALSASFLLVLSASVHVLRTDGASGRFASDWQEPKRFAEWRDCFNEFEHGVPKLCHIGAKNEQARADFLFVGDSHARAMRPAIEHAAARHGMSGLFAATSACLPLEGIHLADPMKGPNCRALVAELMRRVREDHIPNVVFAARWSYYTTISPFDYTFMPVTNDTVTAFGEAESRRVFAEQLAKTMDDLRALHARAYVISQIPQQRHPPEDVFFRAQLLHRPQRSFLLRDAENEALMKEANAILSKNPNVAFYRAEGAFCQHDDTCTMFDGDVPLYFDNNHVTAEGAERLAPVLDELFTNMQQRNADATGR
jgi:peptidoglycan/LPS O-acetylase OafA/YrhL